MDFAVSAEPWVKIKGNKKIEEIEDLAKELRSIKVKIRLAAVGALKKGLEKLEISAGIETVQKTEKSWRLECTYCHSVSSERIKS